MKAPTLAAPEKASYNPPFLRLVSVISIMYLLYYLWWRATATLNPDAPFFSWLLLLAEGFGVVVYFLFAWMTQNISPTRRLMRPKPGLSVDIFIPTYNESLEILEATMTGCKKITYPHTTYVLDDGQREAVRQLAVRLGCHYLTRSNNAYAKAGNINQALPQTKGEFIVFLDADMVPQPNFLDRTLGYFEDAKLAFIQLPQEFYNWDSIQHDEKALEWHEQSLFFRVIQPGKNRSNSAFWCGSPSILRRKALEEVGGVATDTITEDIQTSVRLHSRGWSSYFVNEPLAYGIAPETMRSFLLQRLRWAKGTMQLYRGHDSPLWIKGLSLGQRLSYLSSFLAYFESFQKLILIVTPAIIILFEVFPMRVGMPALLLRWLPYFAITVLANRMGGRGYFRYFQTEKYNLLKMAVFLQSTPILFQRKRLAFEVTPKSFDLSVYRKERRSLRAYFIFLASISGVIIFGLIKVRAWSALTINRQLYILALVWAAYNAGIILIAISEVLSKPHERKHYRFRIQLEGELIDKDSSQRIAAAHILDLSISGVGFMTDQPLASDRGNLQLHFDLPGHEHVILPLSNIQQRKMQTGDKCLIGASLSDVSASDRERLFEYLSVYLPGTRLAYAIEERKTQPRSANLTSPSPVQPPPLPSTTPKDKSH